MQSCAVRGVYIITSSIFLFTVYYVYQHQDWEAEEKRDKS